MGGKNNQDNQGNQGGAGGNLGLYGGNQNQTQQNVGGMKNNGAGQQYSQQQAPQYRQAPGYMGGNPSGNDNPSSFQNLYNEYVSNPSQPEVGTGNPYMMPPRLNSPWTPTRPTPTGSRNNPSATDSLENVPRLVKRPFTPTGEPIGYNPNDNPFFNQLGDIFPRYGSDGRNNPRPIDPTRATTDNFRAGTGGVNGPDMFAGGSPTFDESAPIGATQPWQPGGDSLTMEAYDNAANPNAPRKPIDFENLNTENRATWDAAVMKEQYRKAFQAAGYSESQIAALEAANNPSQTNQYRKDLQERGYSESQIAALEAANNPAPVLYE